MARLGPSAGRGRGGSWPPRPSTGTGGSTVHVEVLLGGGCCFLKGLGHNVNIFLKFYKIKSVLSLHAPVVFLNFFGSLLKKILNKKILLAF